MKKIYFQPNYLVPSLVILILVSGASFVYSLSQPKNQVTENPVTLATITNISARGRIQPQNEVIKLSASPTLEGAKIAQLLVKTGDRVQAEQIIAILDNYPRLQAALKQAETQVAIKRANLAKVEAGAKSGEIEAQKALINVLEAQLEGTIATQQAKITRLETQLQGEAQTQRAKIEQIRAKMSHAQAEYERYQSLYNQGAIAVSGFDTKRTEWETATQELQEAQANLTRITTVIAAEIRETEANLRQNTESLTAQIRQAQATLKEVTEIRPTDIQIAQAELANAEAGLAKAQADLELAYVRSPQPGQILQINQYPGEVVNPEGIVSFGQTEQMYVVAEVYETDITRVKLGQKATIISPAFPDKLQGEVTEIGLQIGQQDVLNTDPVSDVDRRVVEVKIRLNPEASAQVISLSHLQVEVLINGD